MQLNVQLNADHLKRILEAVRRQIATPQEMLSSVGESLLRANQNRHSRSLAPDGSAWTPLSTLTRNAESSRRGGPLNKSGRMLDSINYQVSGNSLDIVFWGDDAWMAQFHQEGTDPYTIKPKNKRALKIPGVGARKKVNHPGLPKRELLAFPNSDQILVSNVLADHLQRVIIRAR